MNGIRTARRGRRAPGIVLFAAFLLTASCLAQPAPEPDDAPVPPDSSRRAEVRKRIETMRVWKLTDVLQLDEKKAALFFPRYQKYLSRVDSLDDVIRTASHEIQMAAHESRAIDYDAQVKLIHNASKERLDAEFGFVEQNRDLLDARQRAQLIVFDRRFNQHLRDMMREMWMQHGPPGPGGGRRMGGGWHHMTPGGM